MIEEEERMDNMNEMLGVQRSDLEHQPEDLLQKHIGDHELGLVFRPPTRYKVKDLVEQIVSPGTMGTVGMTQWRTR